VNTRREWKMNSDHTGSVTAMLKYVSVPALAIHVHYLPSFMYFVHRDQYLPSLYIEIVSLLELRLVVHVILVFGRKVMVFFL
jgi:hypothetical protein